jgi:endonuclease/exonuclease/phosphatase (EEP) superfamily protein YafD
MKRVLAAVGALAIVGALLPIAGRLSWIFDLFTHFRVQLVVALVALIIVFAIRRAYPWCAALAVCAAVNVAPLLPYLPFADVSAAASPTLSLLEVNVQASNDAYAGLLDSIAQTDPDVVLAVEFTDAWGERLASLSAEYPYEIRHARHDAFGIALFSRYPVERAS